MTRTIYTDNNYELETSWSEKGVEINIRNCNWLENPTEDLSVKLNSYDIAMLIDELEIYKDAVAECEAKEKHLENDKK